MAFYNQKVFNTNFAIHFFIFLTKIGYLILQFIVTLNFLYNCCDSVRKTEFKCVRKTEFKCVRKTEFKCVRKTEFKCVRKTEFKCTQYILH